MVGADDTAQALGSGDVPVLATPRLLAWLEAATVAAIDEHLPTGTTTVGVRVHVEHLRATRPGGAVTARATLVGVDGALLTFDVHAEDERGEVLARGNVTRAVVDRDRFLARL
jgi:predicted thioesterase